MSCKEVSDLFHFLCFYQGHRKSNFFIPEKLCLQGFTIDTEYHPLTNRLKLSTCIFSSGLCDSVKNCVLAANLLKWGKSSHLVLDPANSSVFFVQEIEYPEDIKHFTQAFEHFCEQAQEWSEIVERFAVSL